MITPSENQFFHCSQHRQCSYEFLLLKKEASEKRLCCCLCLYSKESKNWKPDLNDSIPLQMALENPSFFIEKLTSNAYLNHLFKIGEIDYESLIKEWISKFEILEQTMLKVKEQLMEKLKEYKDISAQLSKLKDDLLEKAQYNTVVKLIYQLQEIDKQYQSDQYLQIEKLLTCLLNKRQFCFNQLINYLDNRETRKFTQKVKKFANQGYLSHRMIN